MRSYRHLNFCSKFQYVPNGFLMIKPTDFRFNEQSAMDNEFMSPTDLDLTILRNTVQQEHQKCVNILKEHGVSVVNFDKSQYPELDSIELPDAVFPDQLTTWSGGEIITYPMYSSSREKEKVLLPFILQNLKEGGFEISKTIAITKQAGSLEGKGSLIIDRRNKQVFASLSNRCSEAQVLSWAKLWNYKPIVFQSFSKKGQVVYHTDIVLAIADKFALVCEEAIQEDQRQLVLDALKGREIIKISLDQALDGFVCNAVEVKALDSAENKKNVFIMSQGAVSHLTEEQKQKIDKYVTLVSFPINLIEKIGGGSARCIIVELFNPVKQL